MTLRFGTRQIQKSINIWKKIEYDVTEVLVIRMFDYVYPKGFCSVRTSNLPILIDGEQLFVAMNEII